MSLKNYRHIITKAIVGKGKAKIETKSLLTLPQKPNRILGCWIVNHHYQAKKLKDHVEIAGHFELNIWYAYGGAKKTAVHVENVGYKELIDIHYDSKPISRDDVYIKSIDDPECESARIEDDGKVCVETSHHVFVEVIGETTVCVEAFDVHQKDESSSPF